MKNDNHIIASVVTAVVLVLLFLFMWFFIIHRPEDIEEPGIEVAMLDPEELEQLENQQPAAAAAEAGSAAPSATSEETAVEPAKVTTTPEAKPVMTQENEEALAAKRASEEKARELAAQEARRKAEEAAKAAKKAEEDAKKAKARSNMAGIFGSGKGSGEGNANTAGAGSSSKAGNNPVGSGTSNGYSWSLNGRGLNGSLSQPAYNSNAEGTVVVSIRVDASGTVISASPGSGTNTSDQSLINAAIAAAKKAKFTSGTGEVVGKITYVFRLN